MLVFVQRFVSILLLLCVGSIAMATDSHAPAMDVEACPHQEYCYTESINCIAHCVSMSCCAAVIAAAPTVLAGSVGPVFIAPLAGKVLPRHVEIVLPPPKQTLALI